MIRVLRLSEGSQISLVDAGGKEYKGEILHIGTDTLTVSVKESCRESTAPDIPQITLFQALPKGDKLELIIQKCTELGVHKIVTFGAARSISRPSEERMQDRLKRWNRISTEASRQANRFTVPKIEFASELSEICKKSDHKLKIILWEEERGSSLRQLLENVDSPESIAVIVGPEGGLTKTEVEMAARWGFVPVSLGNRILRTETASIAIIAILQFYWGNLE
jgi:16S rRNA (uracil1498-N3)-methyltransferase